MTGDPELVQAIKGDYQNAPISEIDRAMLDYAAKLTLEPWTIEGSDIERLRELGFDDRGILDICQVTSYYAFVNRLADGLGVELEGYWDE